MKTLYLALEGIMQSANYFLIVSLVFISFVAQSCNRSGGDVWEDTKSSGRHMSRGFQTLVGIHGDSRAVQCKEDFMPVDDDYTATANTAQTSEFVALPDQGNSDGITMADYVAPQPSETPGEAGSSIPGINAFKDPATIPGLANIFKNVHFEYNSNLIKGQENINIVKNVAQYMKQNTNAYVFVEGHCDERGPEAYNLALGSRRANAVRNMLIQEGVSPDNLFTISYGKERPLIAESNDESWGANRRAEFKIYMK